jgi:peptidoglycan/xylan/chitin deacetylase (PgdA/CDA1 family)
MRGALASGASTFLAKRRRAARVVMYHGVGPQSDLPTAELERQVLYLKRHFRVVSLDQLLDGLSDPARAIADWVALTFDDGVRNNLTEAWPVLLKHRVPAVFYVCPALIDQRRWIWNHEARARLESLADAERHAFIAQCGPSGDDGGDGDDKTRLGLEGFLAWMKTLALEPRRRVEDALRARTGAFRPSPALREAYDLMDWDELTRLDPSLVTIGSHTLTHPILTTLAPAEARREIQDSRAALERRLGRPVRHFCFPNGDRSPALIEMARQAYDSAVLVEPGVIRPGADPHRLPRVAATWPLDYFAWRLRRVEA